MKKLIIFSLCMILSALAGSRAYGGGPGTTTASFLKIGVGARNIAMGETSDARGDANAMYWNPAGLAYLQSPDASLMHAVWLQEITYDNLAVAYPFKYGVLGLNVSYLSSGQIQEYDANDVLLPATYQAADTAVALAYARIIHDFSIGASLKYIGSYLEAENASAFALDAGAAFEGIKHWRMRMSFQNLGTQMKFMNEGDPLPLNFRAGCSYEAIASEKMSLLCVLDVNFPIDNYIRENAGLEYVRKLKNKIEVAIRAGYKTSTTGLDAIDGLTCGLGVSFQDYRFDYAFVPYGDLGDTHRISLGWRFGGLIKYKKPAPAEKPVQTEIKGNEQKTEEKLSQSETPAVQVKAGERHNFKEEIGEQAQAENMPLIPAQAEVVSKEKPEQAENKPLTVTIAIADFQGNNVPDRDVKRVSDLLGTKLADIKVFNVVNGSNNDKLLSEAGFRQTGAASTEDAVKMGKILNVNAVVTGNVSRSAKGNYYIVTNVVNVETGEIVCSRTAVVGSQKAFRVACNELSQEISEGGYEALQAPSSRLSDFQKAPEVNTIYFDFDKRELLTFTLKALNKNAEYLKTHEDSVVLIEGHTDERGLEVYNLALGDMRLSAVREYYLASGVKKNRIVTISYGSAKPETSGHDEAAFQKNRRVDTKIRIIK